MLAVHFGFSGVVATTVSRGHRRCDLVRKPVGWNGSSSTEFPPGLAGVISIENSI